MMSKLNPIKSLLLTTILVALGCTSLVAGVVRINQVGNRHYQHTNHLENVVSVTSDKTTLQGSTTATQQAQPKVVATQDYGAFGASLPGRSSTSNYRYGFNGMEQDPELHGAGNSYDFGARLYNPRLGRWLSRDAMAHKYMDLTPYAFAANNPLYYRDPDGNDIDPTTSFMNHPYIGAAFRLLASTDMGRHYLSYFSTDNGYTVTPASDCGTQCRPGMGVVGENTDLVFKLGGANGNYGVTEFFIEDKQGNRYLIDGVGWDVDKLDPNLFTPDAKVIIEITINPEVMDNMEEALETQIHELGVHVVPFIHLLEQLRSGELTRDAFKTALYNEFHETYEQHAAQQHWNLGNGQSKAFTEMVADARRALPNDASKQRFDSHVANDQNTEYKATYNFRELNAKSRNLLQKASSTASQGVGSQGGTNSTSGASQNNP